MTSTTDGADEATSTAETGESGESSSESTGQDDVDTSSGETDESDTTDENDTTGDPACARKQYTFNLDTQTWSSIALDQAWIGENAPDCSVGIAAASLIADWDVLIVVAEDQMIYWRDAGVWQTPLAWGDSFAALVGETPTAAVYAPNPDDTSEATLYLNLDDGRALLYALTEVGGISLADIIQLEDGDPPAAPQGTEIARWSFALADADAAPSADWLVWTMNYNDGNLYTFNAAFTWTQSPEDDNELFGTGQADEPVPAQIEAAFADLSQGRAYFVAE
ncbi:hypothetical protein G6O69_34495 [Pseudenhygromyxa sp. WMMC2535]|uniref:hypothetical protein n=1 Tax=Pseudenhygromyxa sp. WMMC2535 TaxID=2712867 RepID=UPI001556B647|nr:hypothetical protein [Pseudenhygromyxa sp. WMMC2535]NVB42983.1 hypothetical protein [Pseudenhygromyxa sp. WMMC2535]